MGVKKYLKIIIFHLVFLLVCIPPALNPSELGDSLVFFECALFFLYPVYSVLIYRKTQKILVPQILLWISALILCIAFYFGKWGGDERHIIFFMGSLNSLIASLLLVVVEKKKTMAISQGEKPSKNILMVKTAIIHFVLITLFYISQWSFYSFAGLKVLVSLMIIEFVYVVFYGVFSVKFTRSILQSILAYVLANLLCFILPALLAIISQKNSANEFLLWKIKVISLQVPLFLLPAIITKLVLVFNKKSVTNKNAQDNI